MTRRILIGLGLVAAVLLCLPAFPPVLREMIWRLPTGWIAFLRRTLPDVTLNWHGVGMVALCSAIILFSLHSICGWLYRTVREGRHASHGPEHWPLRWTGALFASFWLLFAVVMSASCLGRQVQWVFQSDQPLYIARNSAWSEIKQAEFALTMALSENETNAALAHAAFMRGDYERLTARPTFWERQHVLLFTNAHGEFVGSILFSRNPRDQDRIGFRVSGEGMVGNYQPMTNLPNTIAHLEKLAK